MIALSLSWLYFLSLLRRDDFRRQVLGRSFDQWFIDLFSLFMQALVIPYLSLILAKHVLVLIIPDYQGIFTPHPLMAFALSFVLVDYLYYLNHRFLHSHLWKLHLLHHSSTQMDLLVTSRNSFWSHFFLVYLWTGALFLYVLKDPDFYLLGITTTALLDLWRHGPILKNKRMEKILSKVFITPNLHSLHHSKHTSRVNFGANFSLWDRFHRTYLRAENKINLGIELKPSTLMEKTFFPWRLNEAKKNA
jgi:sterol desaturase/sphingolipid hydroxylase (fatty acid hydroxylase superfamily)